jgi:hypothetical protein
MAMFRALPTAWQESAWRALEGDMDELFGPA